MNDPTNENRWAHQVSINNDTISSLDSLDKRLREVERRMPEDHIDRHLPKEHECQHGTTCIEGL